MALYRDEAVVIRTHKLGEADRIVTLLTRRHGMARAVAKGVRRTTSKFGARLEPFMVIDVQLHEGRSLDTVTQVELLRPYGLPIAADYPRYTAAQVMAETVQRLVPEEGQPALQQFLLLVGALRTLAEGPQDPSLVLDSYLVRALAVGGYAASFSTCVRCGEGSTAAAPLAAFHVGAGGAVCPRCRPAGSVTVEAATLGLLAALLEGDWAQVQASQPRTRREASAVVAAYTQWHLERGLRTLGHVQRHHDNSGSKPVDP